MDTQGPLKKCLRDYACYDAIKDDSYFTKGEKRFQRMLDLIDKRYSLILHVGPCQEWRFIHEKLPESKIFLIPLGVADVQSWIKDNNLIVQKVSDLNKAKLPFPDDHCDLILASELIENLHNPDNFLHECYRVLKTGGDLILSTPNLASWINRILLFFGYFPRNLSISGEARATGLRDIFSQEPRAIDSYGWHIRIYTLSALKILLKIHHFKINSVKRFHGDVFLEKRKDLRLLFNFGNFITGLFPPLATTILLKATKVQ